MKAILGRLTDLGVKELFKLLTSADAAGELEIESLGARSVLQVRRGHVAGEPSAPLVHAVASRSGTFCFRPGPVSDGGEWFGLEEFLARVDALVARSGVAEAAEAGEDGAAVPGFDPLAELRLSLAEVALPGIEVRVLVVTADPRPYRVLEPEWRQRGWEVEVRSEAGWDEAFAPDVVVVHLPTSATLAGQGKQWLEVARQGSGRNPRVPVIWVGGLSDPWLRHQAVVAGVEFLIPSPAGEAGEAARWFREDLTLVAERLLARRDSGAQREAAAFRDFFLALHADAAPGDVRASLLRFAGDFFSRALLLAVRDDGFAALGGFGFSGRGSIRLPRGTAVLEHVVIARRPARAGDLVPAELSALASALGIADAADGVELFPLLKGGECLAVLLGHGLRPNVVETASLASLLARSGSLLVEAGDRR